MTAVASREQRVAPDFSQRSPLSELMDTETVSFEDFRECLRDLASVNRFTFAHSATLNFLERLVARAPKQALRPLEIVDVGSGYGDLLRTIAVWARARGVAVALTGVDLNPWSARAASEATSDEFGIRWVTADAFEYSPSTGIDVVVSSLFTHHLPDSLVTRFLTWMDENARVGWFINDLHRHRVPYHFFRHWARLARWHRFVQHDGPVSIARAFKSADWRSLVRQAKLDPSRVVIRHRFPFRITVERMMAAR